MIEINKVNTPDVDWWLSVLEGMRYPYKSTKLNDSFYCYGDAINTVSSYVDCEACSFGKYNREFEEYDCTYTDGVEGFPTVVLGKNDFNLLMQLCKSGSSHRKVLRQLPVLLDINAPIYWWKQLDQYSVGTTTNSESLMHCLTKEPFKLDDFSVKNLDELGSITLVYGNSDDIEKTANFDIKEFFEHCILNILNGLRDCYLETNDKEFWYAMIELLPQSYMQKRCWTGNYEVLVNIIEQRLGHELPEWKDFIITCITNVPYLREILIACHIVTVKTKEIDGKQTAVLIFKDKKNGEWKTLCKLDDTYPRWC